VNRNATLFVGACLGVAVLAGCAHSIRIKAVDATTGQPLVGVATEWRQNRHQMFQRIAHTAPTNLPPSGQEGLIEVRGIYRTWNSQFVFSLPGYSTVYGHYYSGGDLNLSTQVSRIPSGLFAGEFYLEGKLEAVGKTNGCFLVRMQK
jgi:hypothetical protein